MNMATKTKVLQANLNKWLVCKGDRKVRGELIKKLSGVLQCHEKSVGRSMKRLQLKDPTTQEKRGRKIYYGKDVDAAIEKVWEAMERPAAENMFDSISEYINFFKKEKSWNFDESTTAKFHELSLGTLKNRITSTKKRRNIGRSRGSTTPSHLKGLIPIRKSHTWVGLSPGYVQADSVVHCGDYMTGDVIYTVGNVDFATYWMEYITQWNKGAYTTKESLDLIKGLFPFVLHEIHPDSGNEFINYHVLAWIKEKKIKMTRSEPYKKNDNMCIEERNGSVVRRHLGHARLDDESLVEVTSEIMRTACLLHNHFKGVRRMISKIRTDSGVWKRKFESVGKTPYKRVMERDDVSRKDKAKLKVEHDSLNPLQLKRDLDKLKVELRKKLKTIKINRELQ